MSTTSENHAVDRATTDDDGRPKRQTVDLEAPISEIVVHARGAVVTRRVELPDDLPTEALDLRCPGNTLAIESGSLRCRFEGARAITSLRSEIHLPEADPGPGPTAARLAELDRRLARIVERHQLVTDRLAEVERIELAPSLGRSLREVGADARTRATLEVVDVLDRRARKLGEQLGELEREHRRLSREREEVALENAQTSDEARRGAGAPGMTVVAELGAGEGGGVFEYSYVVGAARWWPVYTLRVENEGNNASLAIEARVAQRSGEDWTGVTIGFATSEIVSDARLPRPPSFRLGRAQPEPPRAFRPPPSGVERLFASFDAALEAELPPAMQPEIISRQTSPERLRDTDVNEAILDQVSMQSGVAKHEAFASEAQARTRKQRGAAPPQASPGAMPPGAAPAPANRGSAGGERFSQASFGGAFEAGGGGGSFAPESPAPERIEPSEGWLDFDSVMLEPASSRRRGKLVRQSSGHRASASLDEAVRRARETGAVDPSVSRGSYDHRYDAEAAVDVPSDGALHRVEVISATCSSSLAWRTNPREDASVYREVTLDNPHPSPLLAGPLDVYVAGSLVANTETETVDRGGTMTVGLGIDERLQVARNAKVSEESAGLLGGKREIDHFVDIVVASSLGFDALVEILDRIPVSDDEHVEVDLFESAPEADRYDQSDRHAPVKGGLRWRIEVLAGEDASIRFAYRVRLRARDELVGGNRRE